MSLLGVGLEFVVFVRLNLVRLIRNERKQASKEEEERAAWHPHRIRP